MTAKQPFFPKYGSNTTVTVGTAATISIDRTCKQVRVVNTGANKGYFRTFNTGDSVAATAADCGVYPGMATTVSKGEHDQLSTFSASGTTFEIMVGEGF